MPALAVLLEYGQERVHAVDDAPQVHAEHPAPVVEGQVGDRRERPDAGVVADHVHGPVPVEHGTGQGVDAGRVAHVGLHAGRADLRGGRFHRVPLDVGDDHPRALGDEPGGDPLPDAGGAAGHHGHLPGQVRQPAHRCPTSSCRPCAPMSATQSPIAAGECHCNGPPRAKKTERWPHPSAASAPLCAQNKFRRVRRRRLAADASARAGGRWTRRWRGRRSAAGWCRWRARAGRRGGPAEREETRAVHSDLPPASAATVSSSSSSRSAALVIEACSTGGASMVKITWISVPRPSVTPVVIGDPRPGGVGERAVLEVRGADAQDDLLAEVARQAPACRRPRSRGPAAGTRRT